jgi:hypothetical protein
VIRLDTFQRKLQAVLGGAVTTNQPTAVVCYTDKENEFQKKFPVEATVSTLNDTTPVDICPAPDKVMVREIDSIHIRNNDTVAATVTVRVNDNGTNYELVEVELSAGDTLVYTHSEGWKTFSLYGEPKTVFPYIDFAIGPYPDAERRLKWNDTDGTLDIGLKGGNVTLQLGLEQFIIAKEHDNLGLTLGKVYYFYDSNGSNKTVKTAIATQANQADRILGIAAENTSGGAKGFIITAGLIRDINTNSLTEGAPVYLSDTVAGNMTDTRPLAPNHAIQIGYCIRKSASVGAIFVAIDAGSHLEYLHDVKLTSLADKQYIRYNSSAGYWENTAAGEFSSLKVDGALEIKDGMTAPSATTGIAKIYVDTADGDLKVIFADGTVKTIVTDT